MWVSGGSDTFGWSEIWELGSAQASEERAVWRRPGRLWTWRSLPTWGGERLRGAAQGARAAGWSQAGRTTGRPFHRQTTTCWPKWPFCAKRKGSKSYSAFSTGKRAISCRMITSLLTLSTTLTLRTKLLMVTMSLIISWANSTSSFPFFSAEPQAEESSYAISCNFVDCLANR